MSDETPGDYEVGYGRPPKETQFKKGKSGNPRGRPRAKSSIGEIVQRVLAQEVPIVINGRRRKVSSREASLHVLRSKALAGDLKAIRMLDELANKFDLAPGAEPLSAERDEEIFQSILKRMGKSTD